MSSLAVINSKKVTVAVDGVVLAHRVPFFTLIMMVLLFVVVSSHPPSVLFFGFLIYAISGPVLTLYQIRQRRRQRKLQQ